MSSFSGSFRMAAHSRQVAVERGLLVHAEEAGVGLDVALGVDRRAEQARRHVLDGAQVAEVDAGLAGDLLQRETGVLAGGADGVADALVWAAAAWAANSIVVVADDAQVRRARGVCAARHPWRVRRAAGSASAVPASVSPAAGTVSSVGELGLVSSLATPLICLSETERQFLKTSLTRLTPTTLTSDYQGRRAPIPPQPKSSARAPMRHLTLRYVSTARRPSSTACTCCASADMSTERTSSLTGAMREACIDSLR